MENNSYRVSNSRDEILKVLNLKFQNQERFIVWQKNPKSESRDFMIEADFKTIDMIDGVFTVQISDEDKNKFNKNIDTYFLLKGQDFAFKTKLAIVQPKGTNILSFQSPKEVRLVELRSNPRMYYSDSDLHNVNVTFESKEDSTDNVESVCRILNISKGGVCLLVSKETLSSINLKKEILIEGLNFFEQIGNLKKAIVKNARVHTKKTLKSDEFYAIGLEFQKD